MAFRLKNTTSPLSQRVKDLDSIGNPPTNTPVAPTPDPRLQIALPEGTANYQQPVNFGTQTISATAKDDGALKQIGTLLSNPFDGIAALGNQARGGIREAFGMRDEGSNDGVRGNLTNLRRANESTDASTKKALENSSGLNTVSQIGMLGSGVALGAQTVNDLLQGDAAGAILKKAKALKPVYKAIKKTGVDPTKLSKRLYTSYKADKNVL
jgi:hypothetical protein